MTFSDAVRACKALHKLGPELCILTGIKLRNENTEEEKFSVIASYAHSLSHSASDHGTGSVSSNGKDMEVEVHRVDVPYVEGHFSGCGDLFASLFVGGLHQSYPYLSSHTFLLGHVLETTAAAMHSVLECTERRRLQRIKQQEEQLALMKQEYNKSLKPHATRRSCELMIVESRDVYITAASEFARIASVAAKLDHLRNAEQEKKGSEADSADGERSEGRNAGSIGEDTLIISGTSRHGTGGIASSTHSAEVVHSTGSSRSRSQSQNRSRSSSLGVSSLPVQGSPSALLQRLSSHKAVSIRGSVGGIIFDMDGTLTEASAIDFEAMYTRNGLVRPQGQHSDILAMINALPTEEARERAMAVVVDEELKGIERMQLRSGLQQMLHAAKVAKIRTALSTRNCELGYLKFMEMAQLEEQRSTQHCIVTALMGSTSLIRQLFAMCSLSGRY